MFQSFPWDSLLICLKVFPWLYYKCVLHKRNHKLHWNAPHNLFLRWAKLSNEYISFVSSLSRTQELSTKSCCNGIAQQPSRQLSNKNTFTCLVQHGNCNTYIFEGEDFEFIYLFIYSFFPSVTSTSLAKFGNLKKTCYLKMGEKKTLLHHK